MKFFSGDSFYSIPRNLHTLELGLVMTRRFFIASILFMLIGCPTSNQIRPPEIAFNPDFKPLGSDSCKRCGNGAMRACAQAQQDGIVEDFFFNRDGKCVARCFTGITYTLGYIQGSEARCGEYEINLRPTVRSGPFCPTDHVRGDAEFAGHGPRVTVDITLRAQSNLVMAELHYLATEWSVSENQPYPGETMVRGGPWRIFVTDHRGFFDSTHHIARILSEPTFSQNFVLNGHGYHELPIPGRAPLSQLIVVGDTGGTDIPNNANQCSDETHIQQLAFKPIRVQIAPAND